MVPEVGGSKPLGHPTQVRPTSPHARPWDALVASGGDGLLAEQRAQRGLELGVAERVAGGLELLGQHALTVEEQVLHGKTLTALALVFALFLTQPSPLCVLDEVDAPLDDANVDRFVALMQEIGEQAGTRFLVVTHHPLTMSRMDRLYGVTMIERGVSRLVSVALEEAVELRATA